MRKPDAKDGKFLKLMALLNGLTKKKKPDRLETKSFILFKRCAKASGQHQL